MSRTIHRTSSYKANVARDTRVRRLYQRRMRRLAAEDFKVGRTPRTLRKLGWTTW